MSTHQPQSIIHQVFRWERKAAKLIKKGLDSASNHSRKPWKKGGNKAIQLSNKDVDPSQVDTASIVTGATNPVTVTSSDSAGSISHAQGKNSSIFLSSEEPIADCCLTTNKPQSQRRASTAFFHSTLDPVIDESMHRESQRNLSEHKTCASYKSQRHPILEVFANDGEPTDGEAEIHGDDESAFTNGYCEFSDESSNLDGSVGGTNYFGDYRTITQNDLFKECFGGGGMWGGSISCSISIVHFFEVDDSSCNLQLGANIDDLSSSKQAQALSITGRSAKIDHILEECAMIHTNCKFLRINGKLTPFIAPKLGVRRFPAVVAMNSKGQVLDKLIDFEMIGLLVGDDEWDEEYILDWIEKSTV